MKTSIDIPDELIERVRKFNEAHPERPIVMSAVVAKSLGDYLSYLEDDEYRKKLERNKKERAQSSQSQEPEES